MVGLVGVIRDHMGNVAQLPCPQSITEMNGSYVRRLVVPDTFQNTKSTLKGLKYN